MSEVGMRRLVTVLALAGVILAPVRAAAQALPAPNHPIEFGYWFSDGRYPIAEGIYNDYMDEVFYYNSLYIAIPGGWDTGADWRPLLAASMAKATAANKKIYLLLSDGGPGFTVPVTVDAILDVVTPYWSSVSIVEVAHETSESAAAVDALTTTIIGKLNARGLALKPFAIMQTGSQSIDPNYSARSASLISYIGIEAYFNVGDSLASVDAFIATAKSYVPAGKNIHLVGQGYDRASAAGSCPSATDWRCHIPELVAIQSQTYLNAYNDTRVHLLSFFNYGRQNVGLGLGGSRFHFALKVPHKRIAEKLFVANNASWRSLPSLCLIACEGQVDGDHIADLTLFRPSDGYWHTKFSTTGYSTLGSWQWALAGDQPLDGDFDGDGRADLVVWRPSDGTWHIRYSSNGYNVAGFSTYQWGLTGDIPLAADYDGDGKSELVVYRPSNFTWYVRFSRYNYNVSQYREYPWGAPGDVPLEADLNGDGRSEIVVFRPSTGAWYVRFSSPDLNFTPSVGYVWGEPGDVPVPGDFDGDAKTDLAIFRPSTGTWWVAKSSSAYTTFLIVQWGVNGDVPIVGDYDNDGKSDLTVWRPSTGFWFVLYSSTNYTTWLVHGHGSPGDIPLSRR
jgi:hypothetical protein